MIGTIAIAIFCRTPAAGQSKTRLSPPLSAQECAALSACFIRDLAATIQEVAQASAAVGYAVYTPAGSEDALRELLPANFALLPQGDGDFGVRVAASMRALLAQHPGAILVNGDSPTLPAAILSAAIDALSRDVVALSPAVDGGYTLIGLSKMHDELFAGIPWSTARVYERTVARAAAIGLPVVNVPGWYDVDDAASLAMLTAELAGGRPPFSQLDGAAAAATRAFLARRR